MAKEDVPLVGGPLDGRSIDVDLDEDGLPPAEISETALWFAWGSELFDTDIDGGYGLEPVAGAGPPWLYRWHPHR